MNDLMKLAEFPPTIFSEARSLHELFQAESRCEQELYDAARRGDWRDLERLMPMYSDLHIEIMMRLWQEVQFPSGQTD
jgi:hypothetical protein